MLLYSSSAITVGRVSRLTFYCRIFPEEEAKKKKKKKKEAINMVYSGVDIRSSKTWTGRSTDRFECGCTMAPYEDDDKLYHARFHSLLIFLFSFIFTPLSHGTSNHAMTRMDLLTWQKSITILPHSSVSHEIVVKPSKLDSLNCGAAASCS